MRTNLEKKVKTYLTKSVKKTFPIEFYVYGRLKTKRKRMKKKVKIHFKSSYSRNGETGDEMQGEIILMWITYSLVILSYFLSKEMHSFPFSTANDYF